MFLVHAKNDRLGEAVGRLEELGQVMRNRFRARAQRNHLLKILGLIFVVGNCAAEPVKFIPAWSPAGGVPLRDDAMNAVRRKETVVDTLPQAVFVDGVPKIEVAIAIIL